MADFFRRTLLVLAASLMAASLLTAVSAHAADDGCIEDWSVAAPIVKAEGLASVEAVKQQARDHIQGQIVKATLCRQGDGYTYRLVVRTPEGQHKSMVVDAKAPFAN